MLLLQFGDLRSKIVRGRETLARLARPGASQKRHYAETDNLAGVAPDCSLATRILLVILALRAGT